MTRDHAANAHQPSDFTRHDLWTLLKRVFTCLGKDNVGLLSAGVAFYGFLSLFPALIALVSLWGLWADTGEVTRMVSGLSDILPADAQGLMTDALEQVAGTTSTRLSSSAVFSILAASWSANRAMKGLVQALGVAFDEPDQRNIVKSTLLTLAFTVGLIFVGVVVLALVAGVPAVLDEFGLGLQTQALIDIGRWPIAFVVMLGVLAFIYRYGPDRSAARWSWVTPGSVVASLLWLVVSAGFSFYVKTFGSYAETYGSLAAPVVLMLWLSLSSFVVLLGAELNAELEKLTAADTTDAPEQPLGERGAVVADMHRAPGQEPA